MSVVRQGNDLFVLDRTKTGERLVKKVENYKPYFYVDFNEPLERPIFSSTTITPNFKTIFSNSAKKIQFNSMSSQKDIFERHQFTKTYEADVKSSDRYILDNYDSLDPTILPRVCNMDIEVDSTIEFPKPEEAKYPITLIICRDSILKKIVVFGWRSDLKQSSMKTADLSIYKFNTEKAMLNSFIDFIASTDPDLIVGWNVVKFDFVYIINRMKRLRIDYRRLSMFNDVYLDDKKFILKIKGRAVVDLLEFYRYFSLFFYAYSSGGIESFSLNAVATKELGEKKVSLDGKSTGDLWRNDLDKLITYGIQDVVLVQKLDDKLGFVNLMNELRCLTVCDFTKMIGNNKLNMSHIIDMYILRYFKNKRIVLPTASSTFGEKYKGAHTQDPVSGLHKNIIVYDIKSLYPSILLSFNIGPDTISCNHADCPTLNSFKFCQQYTGLIKLVMQELYDRRIQLSVENAKLELNSPDWKKMHMQQFFMKLILNSMYGIMGYQRFRMYNVDVAGTVTFVGRDLIQYLKARLEEKGKSVIYIDTDSLFVSLAEDIKEEDLIQYSRVLQTEINAYFDDYMKQYSIKNTYFKVEIDKIYTSVLFTEAKKRYIGMTLFLNGKEEKKLSIIGFDVKKRSTPVFAQNMLRSIYIEILNGSSHAEVLKFIKNEIKSASTVEPSLLASTIRIGLPIDKYTKNILHVRGMRYAQQHLQLNFQRMDFVKIYYIKDVRNLPKTDVVTLQIDERLPEIFSVDIEKTVEKYVLKKLDSSFEALNWSTETLYKGQKSLDLF